MSIEDRVPASQLDEASEAFEQLAAVLADEQSLGEVLQQLAESATRVIPDAENVSVTIIRPDGAETVAATDDAVVAIDSHQYAAGRGPSLEAALSLRPLRAAVAESRARWPEFVTAAEAAGVRAYLSAPMVVDGSVLGALNLHSSEAAAFDPFDEALLRLFTTAASTSITGFRRYERSRELVVHLRRALESRSEIEQAKGVLMAAHGITADEAFSRLVATSQTSNTKLRVVAGDLLDSLRRP